MIPAILPYKTCTVLAKKVNINVTVSKKQKVTKRKQTAEEKNISGKITGWKGM